MIALVDGYIVIKRNDAAREPKNLQIITLYIAYLFSFGGIIPH